MIKHLSKWDFKHPDIVSILTFVAYSGSCKEDLQIRFSGPALNRIIPILSKYFSNIRTHYFEYSYPRHSTMRLNICNTRFIRQARANGWSFKKSCSDNGVPDYVFQDIDLFRHFLATVIDSHTALYFDNHNLTDTTVLKMTGACADRWKKLRFYLDYYGLPIGHLQHWGKSHKVKWYNSDIYKLLDFIGWDLQRPWNVRMMKYMRENREARMTPKRKFL